MIRSLKDLKVGTISRLATVAAFGLSLALAACATIENSLSPSDIASMKLTDVTVSFTTRARLQSEDIEQTCSAAAHPGTDDQSADANRRQQRTNCMEAALAPKIKVSLEQALAGVLVGIRPVRLEISVDRFNVAPVAWRAIVGDMGPYMTAAARLVDARTGTIILAHPKLRAFLPPAGGIIGAAVSAGFNNATGQTFEERLIALYAQMYRAWLTHGV
jgi:hypothetical protein